MKELKSNFKNPHHPNLEMVESSLSSEIKDMLHMFWVLIFTSCCCLVFQFLKNEVQQTLSKFEQLLSMKKNRSNHQKVEIENVINFLSSFNDILLKEENCERKEDLTNILPFLENNFFCSFVEFSSHDEIIAIKNIIAQSRESKKVPLFTLILFILKFSHSILEKKKESESQGIYFILFYFFLKKRN